MSFRIFWQVPQQLLGLELEGDLSLDDFQQINQAVNEYLGIDIPGRRIALLVDISRQCTIPQAFAVLRASQTYVLRRDLKFVLVAGSDKLRRLMILLTFNVCRPSLRFFDSLETALRFAQILGPVPAE